MTREETEALAKSQPRYQVLMKVWNDLQRDDWKGIDILYRDGMRTPIGNPEVISKVKKLIIELLSRHIAEAREECRSAVQ